MKKFVIGCAGLMLLSSLLLFGCGQATGESSSAKESEETTAAETSESSMPDDTLVETGVKPGSETAESSEAYDDAAAILMGDIPTVQYYLDEAVPEEDIEKILYAGINAPSAMNKQPWHFAAVTDKAVLGQISEDMSAGMPEGAAPPAAAEGAVTKAGIADVPLAIIISCKEGSDFDAGLSCQAMSAEAQLLGYGTKIISSPTIALNGEKQDEYKELLGIPDEQAAVAVILIGYEDTSIDDTVDGYTGPTERNPFDDVVTRVEAE